MSSTQATLGAYFGSTPFHGSQGKTGVILAAMASHILFKLLEPQSISGILLLLLGPPTALAILLGHSQSDLLLPASILYPLYFVTLSASIVAYRLSPLHPLARFPGPIICKITRLWAFYIVYAGDQHLYYQSLHEKYGTHVRTGPNHLFICDAGALPKILGSKGFPRSRRYQMMKQSDSKGSLLSLADVHDHAQRRRIWDRAMNTSAVQGYQDQIESRINQLIDAIRTRRELDLSMWLSSFSFDFMGDLAFGGAFRLMEQGSDPDGYMGLAHTAVRSQEMIGTIPWINPFIFTAPSSLLRYYEFAKGSVLARKAQMSTRKDIFYYLLDEEGLGSHPLSVPTLISESALAIGAGSGTVGTSLSNLFFFLIAYPDVLTRLRREIDLAFPAGSDTFNAVALGEMKYLNYLNAVINETLRMWPAVPNGVPRTIPHDSPTVIIAGRPVPPSTTVQVSTFSMHRDPRYFSPAPDSFRPERWLNEPGYKTDQAAYFPFSHGPTNCVGKNLAMQELRMVTCALVSRFEFSFAPGWDKSEWEKNLHDAFVLTKGCMPVVVDKRA